MSHKTSDDLMAGIRGYLQRNVQPIVDGLRVRLKALEDRVPEKGDPGPVGETGDKGDIGEKGEKGDRGDTGQTGEKGDRGDQGLTGEKGDRGDQGDIGVVGEKGDRGDTGITGEKGDRGERGERGDIGTVGEKGDRGDNGQIGDTGASGERGQKGEDGEDGEDGRDALQVDVLDGIDSIKRYQRGTFAAYRGGLVRSFRATDAMPEDGQLETHGWHVILRGVHEFAFEAGENLRSIGIAMQLTDGQVVCKTIQVPVMIYRGIWKEGEDYKRGDTTTYDGCTWVLVGEEQKAAPRIEDSGWQLSVKRGRDGRDGLKGATGERGAEGRAGKDLTQMGPNGKKW